MLTSDIHATDLAHIAIIERCSAAVSIFSGLSLIVTFLGCIKFHKSMNRLVFFATVGNIGASIATAIARDAISGNGSIRDKVLCYIQAFLIQWLMPADVYMTFAMAINIILTFYYRFVAEDLRRVEKYYLMACYGVPFLIALVQLIVSIAKSNTAPIFGDATLWCWVSSKHDSLRIALFYAPVWAVVLSTMIIYAYAGRDINYQRKQLHQFSQPTQEPIPITQVPLSSEPSSTISVTHSVVTESSSSTVQPTRPLPAVTKGYSVSVSATPGPVYRHYATRQASSAMWSYSKIALLFFVAMLITWLPSSANRAYSWIHKHQTILWLNYVSAFVLPLQGFWNAVIYFTTSLDACKYVCKHGLDWSGWKALVGRYSTSREAFESGRPTSSRKFPGKRSRDGDGDSDTELRALSRPGTREESV